MKALALMSPGQFHGPSNTALTPKPSRCTMTMRPINCCGIVTEGIGLHLWYLKRSSEEKSC